MKKLYTTLVLFAVLLVNYSFAQSRVAGNTLTPTASEPIVIGKNPLPLVTYTMMPTSFSYTCAASKYYYHWDVKLPYDTGYVFGNNIFGETECSQKYNFYTGNISQVLVRYGHKRGTTGSTASVIYSIDPTTKAPQNALGTSAAVTTANISTTGYTAYSFSPVVAVSGGFHAAVQLPTTTGDTAVIVVNVLGCSTSDSLAWEKFPTLGWFSAAYNYGPTNNTDLVIIPVGDVNAGVNEYSANGLSLLGAYPNPAKEQTSIRYHINSNTAVSIVVFDLEGRILSESSETLTSGDHEFNLGLKNLSAGNYYYSIKTDVASLTSKFSIVK